MWQQSPAVSSEGRMWKCFCLRRSPLSRRAFMVSFIFCATSSSCRSMRWITEKRIFWMKMLMSYGLWVSTRVKDWNSRYASWQAYPRNSICRIPQDVLWPIWIWGWEWMRLTVSFASSAVWRRKMWFPWKCVWIRWQKKCVFFMLPWRVPGKSWFLQQLSGMEKSLGNRLHYMKIRRPRMAECVLRIFWMPDRSCNLFCRHCLMHSLSAKESWRNRKFPGSVDSFCKENSLCTGLWGERRQKKSLHRRKSCGSAWTAGMRTKG